MKFCIFGASAIGGFFGARLARAGAEVSVIAGGPHLEAMRRNGVRLISDGDYFVVNPLCTADPAEVAPQDYIILTRSRPRPPARAASRVLSGAIHGRRPEAENAKSRI